jgi:hypothetical protein
MRKNSYIDGLYKMVEQENEKRELAKQQDQKSQTIQTAPIPLEQQILDLTRGHNSDRKWTMAEFIACLTGTYSEQTHPQKISEILKRHNWRRHRTYGKNAGRYWLPPA